MGWIETNMVVFCQRQAKFIDTIDRLKIARIIEFGDYYNAITGKIECTTVDIRVPKILSGLLHSILNRLITDDGKIRKNRLMAQGLY